MGLLSATAIPRRSFVLTVLAVVLLAPLARSQTSVEARTAAINRILTDYRDDFIRHDPETASLHGDMRFNNELSDLSASAANARLSRGQTYIQRLSEITTAGLPDETRTAAEHLLNTLIEEQSSDAAKTWLRPIDQLTRLHLQLLAIADKLPFTSPKDYDDYLARVKKIPAAFSQIMTNIQLASDAGRLPAKSAIDPVLTQLQTTAAQPPETSPFAAPLKRFPTSIPTADRKRITTDLQDTLANEVLPAYARVARFLAAHE